jgi:hypothetical protein
MVDRSFTMIPCPIQCIKCDYSEFFVSAKQDSTQKPVFSTYCFYITDERSPNGKVCSIEEAEPEQIQEFMATLEQSIR